MPLNPGTKLGQYEVVEAIGAGGMGEVYLARDTKLGRDVAIKVLPEEFARDKDRLERFQREARLLAQVNHANIATLYGLEEHDGQKFIVMELVEGETLAERIAKGRIPIDEAIPLFIQIAEGLEAAHEKGIVHRDLKPGNIKIGPDGKPKILDFGLAKAFVAEDGAVPDSSQSPTLTKGTALGMIMGTPSYMSPEQARGKAVDKRTDVFAFGCCLYEALTGKRTFEGETVPDTLTAVLGKEPDWSRVPAATPQALCRLLERALRKDVLNRLQHIGDARVELSDATAEPSVAVRAAAPTRVWLAALLLGALGGFVLRAVSEPASVAPPRSPAVRTRMVLPDELRLVVARGIDQREDRYPPVAISRDGRHVAIVARDATGVSQLYVRALDTLELLPLPGTERAELPFFSPDGQWVGFVVGGRVFKSPVRGGVPTVIGNAPFGEARGAAWISDECIVLGGVNAALACMNATTGLVEPLTEVNSNRYVQHNWPHALADGEHVLFTAWSPEHRGLAVASLATGDWSVIDQTADASQPTYLDSGHLVFVRNGGMFVAPFSLTQLAIDGPIMNVPFHDLAFGKASGVELGYYAASPTGTLVFVPGTIDLDASELVRVDRFGVAEPLSEPRRYTYVPVVSPDGTRLVVTSVNNAGTSSDLFLYDLRRGSRARLTQEGGMHPFWSADGRRLYFNWFPGGDSDLFVVSADGSAKSETLVKRPFDQYVVDASADGRLLVFEETHPETGWDLHVLPLDDNEPYPFVATTANERDAAFSPNSRFLAYTSDENGRDEIYVQALSGEGGRVPVSVDGGIWPRWSVSGDELFYRQGTTMMAVPVELDPTFRPGIPRVLFDGDYADKFDVFPNGDFAMITLADVDLRELEVVVNWSTELELLVPTHR